MGQHTFVFDCCWACKHCAYDSIRNAVICSLYSTPERARIIYQPHHPVNCVSWEKKPEK